MCRQDLQLDSSLEARMSPIAKALITAGVLVGGAASTAALPTTAVVSHRNDCSPGPMGMYYPGSSPWYIYPCIGGWCVTSAPSPCARADYTDIVVESGVEYVIPNGGSTKYPVLDPAL